MEGWTMEVTQAERLVWQVSFDAIDPNVPRPDWPSGDLKASRGTVTGAKRLSLVFEGQREGPLRNAIKNYRAPDRFVQL
jgi:hypothetical protein